MKAEEIAEKVRTLAGPVAEGRGCELVDAQFTVERGRRILRLYIDKPGGVTVDDCAEVSREFSTVLDVEDIIHESYSLEVSSPGLDRLLKTEGDFTRFAGRKVKIRTKEPIEGRRNFRAVVEGVEGGTVLLVDSDGKRWAIRLSGIEKANLVIEL